MSRFGGSSMGNSSGKTSANSLRSGATRGSLSLTKMSPEGESSARNISESSWVASVSSSVREMILTVIGEASEVRGFIGVFEEVEGVGNVWEGSRFGPGKNTWLV